ncbi:ATP-binding cassette domain-containing protein [Kineosporia rhizophila]|uniref:ATP-binding cassette domain-containing protein n=1 Tax=Kineosporia rhizophila TaxID=84633 RepID=UPI001E33C105|nr:ATP-binding cassette domain-containing protein [Kineosporia rhizophila]MCE0538581.1 ATP-binding cassette domain-containing protein [Kineosporia rhizophila]
MNETMVQTRDLSKTYGRVQALSEVNVSVPTGSVLSILGHNGAGKTTLVNILATLAHPSSGQAFVAGYDVVRQPHQVRQTIGLTGQFAAVDEQLPGLENLVLIARLLGAGRRQAHARAHELLEMFELTEAARRLVRTYSGGMRRRLDVAASLLGSPGLLFLDEPTTGLDPAARMGVWQIVRSLVAQGTTVLLTTQYLDEADRLADSVVVMSDGVVVASGTPQNLKERVGRRTVQVTVPSPHDGPRAVAALDRAGLAPAADLPARTVTVPLQSPRDTATVVRALDEAGVEVDELTLREPSLDDVFIAYTRTGRGRTP